MNAERFLPFADLRSYTKSDFTADLIAGATVIFMAVPQAIAYALIAGLPPSVGLYASSIPVIVGALFRSSRHVITAPSNALSLLVGAAFAKQAGLDVVQVAVTLATMVGLIQIFAGLLGVAAIVDYISSSVLLGYITGAALLIIVGQLPTATGSPEPRVMCFTASRFGLAGSIRQA